MNTVSDNRPFRSGARPPILDGPAGLEVLRKMIKGRSLLSGLRAMHENIGDVFQITLPNFNPVFLAGPDANKQVLVSERDRFLWRNESDPVCKLLRNGVLVVDGEQHDHLRGLMEPVLQRGYVENHTEKIWQITERFTQSWPENKPLDMLVEMRKLALLILMDTLFGVDFWDDLDRMWNPILKSIKYISPGTWLVWPDAPRPGFKKPLQELDDYLFGLIQARRMESDPGDNLLTRLVRTPEMTDDLIRDQLLTMLIAGHDTSTALLAWALYLLGAHDSIRETATVDVRQSLAGNTNPGTENLKRINSLDPIIKEALRLFPPIHVSNRRAGEDVEVGKYHIPEDTRVMASIFLSHRHPDYWENPDEFCPARFEKGHAQPPPLTYIPFGAGPRNCIGAAFSQIEARAVLGYLLQTFDFELLNKDVRIYMGATLEPRPGVSMRVQRVVEK